MGLFSGGKNPKQVYYRDMPYDYDRLVDISSRAGTQGYNLRMSLLPQMLGLLGYSGTPTGKAGREAWDISQLASPDMYADPVTELELENAQRLLSERLARQGAAPGGTSFAQLQSEFARNAAAARGQARTDQFSRLMGLSGLWEPLTSTAGGVGSQGLNYLSMRQGAENTRAGLDTQSALGGLSGIGSLLGTGLGLSLLPQGTLGGSYLGGWLGGLGGGSGLGPAATSGLRAGLLPRR